MTWDNQYRLGMRQVLACLVTALVTAAPVAAQADEDLTEFSLEELMNVEVTSVSKKTESKMDAAASVTVITSEDLRRGGFTSVPEALRTVPGVQVARIDAHRWAVSIRGFMQEFTNKLLVMIDGRSVYTPIFGGTFWNEQNLPIEDIARIEVVRGPGGTLWGANAVNGIINVITKTAAETQGVRTHIFAGSHESGVAGRYGDTIGDSTQFRFSLKGEKIEDYDLDQNTASSDSMGQLRAGLRVDSELSDKDKVSLFADYFDLDTEAAAGVAPPPFFATTGFNDQHFKQRGGNVLLKYGHDFESGSRFEVKTFYNGVLRRATSNQDSHTFDIETQHDFSPIENLSVSWGTNYRYWTTHFKASAGTVAVDPNDETFHLGSAFLQLKADFFDKRLSLIGGTKLSYGNWSAFQYQPSLRAIAKPVDGHTVWAAVSRAVRTPTYIDRDIEATIGPFSLNGDRNFRSEEMVSVEAGYRFHQFEWIAAELSGFYSFYDEYSSLSSTGPTSLQFGNQGDIKVRGLEIEVTMVPAPWARVVTGYSVVGIDDDDLIRNVISGARESKRVPQHQFSIRSFFDLPYDLELDAALYYVDGLPGFNSNLDPDNIEEYFRLDLRLGWRPIEWMEISLVGQNLADRRHAEFSDVQRNQASRIPRSGYAKFTFDF
ncbi:MAG: TonB-dependent receptor plug domain-containing protein [Myxococcota bacterium]